MNLPVLVAPEAESQIVEIDGWWRLNRSGSPGLSLGELTACFGIISGAPNIGKVYRPFPLPLVRRLLLTGTRYHVYYTSTNSNVIVLAVWHARRGSRPPISLDTPT